MKKTEQNNKIKFLKDLGIVNKTHINVLLKYKELIIPRVLVFLISILSLMTATKGYVLTASIIYISLEIFFHRYNKHLLQFYGLENSGDDLVLKQDNKEDKE